MVRILAFGDSLTAGYHMMGQRFAPWAPVLKSMLGVAAVDHIGLSGFTTQQMLDAADDATTYDVVPMEWPGYHTQLRKARYDLVLIMGGTNDLADKVPTAVIVRNLEALHRAAHAAGARTVAMTIPESGSAMHVPWLGDARRRANEAIQAWASAEPPDRTLFVDAAAFVPYNEGGSPHMWENDGLHMSAHGYEAFGRALAPLLAPHIARLAPSTPSASASPSEARDEAAAAAEGFVAGALVRIHGLVKAAEHNGKTGRLLERKGRDGRVAVALDADGGAPPLSVRRQNLELVGGQQ